MNLKYIFIIVLYQKELNNLLILKDLINNKEIKKL